jgi:DnaJ-domain-containing protein 1
MGIIKMRKEWLEQQKANEENIFDRENKTTEIPHEKDSSSETQLTHETAKEVNDVLCDMLRTLGEVKFIASMEAGILSLLKTQQTEIIKNLLLSDTLNNQELKERSKEMRDAYNELIKKINEHITEEINKLRL